VGWSLTEHDAFGESRRAGDQEMAGSRDQRVGYRPLSRLRRQLPARRGAAQVGASPSNTPTPSPALRGTDPRSGSGGRSRTRRCPNPCPPETHVPDPTCAAVASREARSHAAPTETRKARCGPKGHSERSSTCHVATPRLKPTRPNGPAQPSLRAKREATLRRPRSGKPGAPLVGAPQRSKGKYPRRGGGLPRRGRGDVAAVAAAR
jgi:hypothetical protein